MAALPKPFEILWELVDYRVATILGKRRFFVRKIYIDGSGVVKVFREAIEREILPFKLDGRKGRYLMFRLALVIKSESVLLIQFRMLRRVGL